MTPPSVISAEFRHVAPSRPVLPKVIVIRSRFVHRHHGRQVIGTTLGALGPGLLLGDVCDLDTQSEFCAPDDASLLALTVTPDSAKVFLDGQLLGRASDLSNRTLVIPPGGHHLEIVAPGVEPYRQEFTGAPGAPTEIQAALGS